jgi:ABC-type phosphate transport system permease subunit/ABC-type phosphate transport system auxiliary subunit
MSSPSEPTSAAATLERADDSRALARIASKRRGKRSTPLSARGEPVVWITGLAMAICLVMIVSLLGLTLVQGSTTFWQGPIERVTLKSGAVLLGMPVRTEEFDPGLTQRQTLAGRLRAGELNRSMFGAGTGSELGLPLRTLYRVGNKEFRGQPYEWVEASEVAKVEREPSPVVLERREWGIWVGYPEAVVRQTSHDSDAPTTSSTGDDSGARAASSAPKREVIAEGAQLPTVIEGLLQQATERVRRIESIKRNDVGEINREMENARVEFRKIELQRDRAASMSRATLPFVAWITLCLLAGASLVGAAIQSGRLARLTKTPGKLTVNRRMTCAALWIIGIALLLPVLLEHPWSHLSISDADIAAARTRYEARQRELTDRYDTILKEIKALEDEDSAYRVIVREPTTGKFAPLRQTLPDEPMRLSQVVRWVQPNTLSFGGKLRVYFDRWREFLFDEPREANTEGGIFPVIFGTVALTLLLSVVVVPLGVIAALYMREYAKQGFIIGLVRIAVNNLAGVPSIVYGVFGLGFFCYSVGNFIDRGPTAEAIMPRSSWWIGLVALSIVVLCTIWISLVARAKPGQVATRSQRTLGIVGIVGWAASAISAIALITGTPYFHGFFEAHPSATFGTRGMLWAALTLALLTLPVVIVATEEAIAAVPRTMREGSYGCGASKWQTIRRIVLPRAMPGIMTGMILAMARGAGEVAPLMLVGAVKLAPELPISRHWPFIHLERSFMHLGFHIYDVGFQSPDSEAARPLVWTTTLVLIALVLLLNVAAIRIRTNLRRKFTGGAF